MKDKLKNTLEHEVELLGRSISVLAIAGLLVVGGASAALLNSFGTVSGDATIDQAVTVNEVAADNSEADAFDQSYDFSAGQAPYEFSDTSTLQNNLEQSVTVDVETGRTVPGSSETGQDEVSSGGFDTGYLFLRNGEAFANGGASAEYVYRNGQAAVEVSNPGSNDGEAGISFEVDAEFDGSNSVSVDYQAPEGYEKNAPDWIIYELNASQEFVNALGENPGVSEGETVRVIDPTVSADSGTTLTYNQDQSSNSNVEENFGDDTLVFDESGETQITGDTALINENLQGQDIGSLKVATGTDDNYGAGLESNLAYIGVDFNGEDLTKSFGTSTTDLTLEANENSELGLANSVPINAYPGTYSVTTDIVPQ